MQPSGKIWSKTWELSCWTPISLYRAFEGTRARSSEQFREEADGKLTSQRVLLLQTGFVGDSGQKSHMRSPSMTTKCLVTGEAYEAGCGSSLEATSSRRKHISEYSIQHHESSCIGDLIFDSSDVFFEGREAGGDGS